MNALRRRDDVRPRALEARVSNPDPDDLTVTIDDFDGDRLTRHAWPAVAWPVSPTATPARGDRCLVVMSEIGNAWVIAAEWTGDALRWTDLVPMNEWARESSSPQLACAKSPTGWVALRGVLTKSRPGSDEQILGTLPEGLGLLPASRRSFPVLIGQNYAARVLVLPDGRIRTGTIPSGATGPAIVTLDGIGYWAED